MSRSDPRLAGPRVAGRAAAQPAAVARPDRGPDPSTAPDIPRAGSRRSCGPCGPCGGARRPPGSGHPGSVADSTMIVPLPAATVTPEMPPGRVAITRASPPSDGSSHSAAFSSSAGSPSGSGLALAKTTDPSGRNAAPDSPLALRVNRRGRPVPVRVHLPQRCDVAGLRRVEGGDRRDQARAVRTQSEFADPWQRHVVVEIEEWRLRSWALLRGVGIGHPSLLSRRKSQPVPRTANARADHGDPSGYREGCRLIPWYVQVANGAASDRHY